MIALIENHIQVSDNSESVAVMELYESGWDLVEDIDTDWLETLPFGTKLYTRLQPKQEQGEPVAWMAVSKSGNARFTDSLMAAKELTEYGWAVTPLYTTPQQSKFLGLTQEEFENDKGA